MTYTIKQLKGVHKEIVLPADKSISHRAVMISSIAKGTTVIKNFLDSQETQATLDCIKKLGVKVDSKYPHVAGIGVEENWPIFIRKYKIKAKKSISQLAAETQNEYYKLPNISYGGPRNLQPNTIRTRCNRHRNRSHRHIHRYLRG